MKNFTLAFLALAAAFAATLTLGSVPARADGIGVSTVFTTGAGIAGDWSQEWNESGVGNFDTILVFSKQGDGLASPGLTDNSGGWTEYDWSPSGYAAELTGPATTNNTFTTNFNDPGTNDVFDFFALSGGAHGTVVDSATIDNFGIGAQIGSGAGGNYYLEETSPTLSSDMSGVTPEPSSLLLLGTGFLGLAVVLFRKAKSSGLVSHS